MTSDMTFMNFWYRFVFWILFSIGSMPVADAANLHCVAISITCFSAFFFLWFRLIQWGSTSHSEEWQVASNDGMAIVTSFSSLRAILFDRVYPLSEHKSLHPWTDLRTPALLKRSHLPSERWSIDPVTDSPCVPVILQCIRDRTKFSLRDSGSRPVQDGSIYEFIICLLVSM